MEHHHGDHHGDHDGDHGDHGEHHHHHDDHGEHGGDHETHHDENHHHQHDHEHVTEVPFVQVNKKSDVGGRMTDFTSPSTNLISHILKTVFHSIV